MNLTEIGMLADKFWLEIPEHFPFAKLDEYIIMPNHVHGIIKIDNTIETLHATSPLSHATSISQGISPKKGSLASVIRSYKSVVTKNAKIINPDFSWQTRFYDHIIRDEKSLNNIRAYIKNNPENWKRLHP